MVNEMTEGESRIQHSTLNIQHSRPPGPFGIYVHLPFCRVHCSYCPFVVSTNVRLQDQYTDALLREIDARAPGRAGSPTVEEADTIFFGGGTPSRTSVENLARIV